MVVLLQMQRVFTGYFFDVLAQVLSTNRD